jgi:hypothetical protein
MTKALNNNLFIAGAKILSPASMAYWQPAVDGLNTFAIVLLGDFFER